MDKYIQERNQEFQETFDSFEKFIQEKYKIEKITNEFIEEVLTSPSTYFWKGCRNLRNMLKHGSCNFLADITDVGLKTFKQEVQKVINPPNAYSICSKKIYQISDNDNIASVLKIMKENNYSNAPVIDEKQFIKGLFNAQTLFLYANNFPEVVIDCKASNIELFKPLYEINNDSEIFYEFVSKTTTIYDINKLFKNPRIKGKRLETVFVTETGNEKQKILGIITPWDMLKYFPEND